jgi:hypothetical protein
MKPKFVIKYFLLFHLYIKFTIKYEYIVKKFNTFYWEVQELTRIIIGYVIVFQKKKKTNKIKTRK